jgi:hypothetical protein
MAPTQYTLSSRLAEDLLKAWISGDEAKVGVELQRVISTPLEPDDIGEEERRHLLKAVAERMRRSDDVFREQDPVVELCVHLLGHLVCGTGSVAVCATRC